MKREKSPFEIGKRKDIQIASQKAVIDKAAIMDITGGVAKNIDEFINLYFNDYCIIDKASVLDISPAAVKIVVIEEEDEPEDDSQAKKKLRRSLEKIVQKRSQSLRKVKQLLRLWRRAQENRQAKRLKLRPRMTRKNQLRVT